MLRSQMNVIIVISTFDFDSLAYFGLGDVGDFYVLLLHLVSGCYTKFKKFISLPLSEASLVLFEDAH